MKKSDFTFKYTSISPISNEGRICKIAYKNNFFAEIEFDYDDIAISFLDAFTKKCKQIAIVDYASRPNLNALKQINKHKIENTFFKSDVYNVFKAFGKLFEDNQLK